MYGVGLSFTASEPDWNDRLQALSPDQPRAYFNLAEEVADSADSDESRELARELFRLAGALLPEDFGSGSCLALADLEVNAMEKRRYLALAELLMARSGQPHWVHQTDNAEASLSAAVNLSKAFGYYRSGRGGRASTMIEKGGTQQLLHLHGGIIGGEDRFIENAKRYRAGLSPIKSERSLVIMLRMEQALLMGDDRSWSGDLLLHDGRTLVEVDPSALSEALQVDPAFAYYRQGRWVRDPGN